MISSPDASSWTWHMHSANVSISNFITPVSQCLRAFCMLFCTSEEQNYFYTSFVPAHKAQTDQEVPHSKRNEVVWFVMVLNRLGQVKSSFSTGLISREQAFQSHWTFPRALGYAVTLSLRQHSGRRTTVVMTYSYVCIGHSTFKIY